MNRVDRLAFIKERRATLAARRLEAMELLQEENRAAMAQWERETNVGYINERRDMPAETA